MYRLILSLALWRVRLVSLQSPRLQESRPRVLSRGHQSSAGSDNKYSRSKEVALGAPLQSSLAAPHLPGQNVNLDYRYADGDTERLKVLAHELVSLAPEVI